MVMAFCYPVCNKDERTVRRAAKRLRRPLGVEDLSSGSFAHTLSRHERRDSLLLRPARVCDGSALDLCQSVPARASGAGNCV